MVVNAAFTQCSTCEYSHGLSNTITQNKANHESNSQLCCLWPAARELINVKFCLKTIYSDDIGGKIREEFGI